MVNKSYVELNGSKMAEQIIRFGWIPEEVPPCFHANNIANNMNFIMSILNNKSAEKSSTYSPTQLSIYKDDLSRRLLSLPNLEGYLKLVKVLQTSWDKIKEYSQSENSLSPITYIHKYDNGADENLNDSKLRDYLKSKSDLIEGILSCIRVALGYKYRMTVDIAHCYDTIYTHSITWAIVGKSQAKQFLKTGSPTSIKSEYKLANNIDILTRKLKNNETNGIVVGPFTSRIFSEIILAKIDKELDKKKYVFKRFVDDYKFYFKTENEANESICYIQKTLNEYNLNLNAQKTKIQKYPYEVISQIEKIFKEALKKEGIFGVLNAASMLYIQGDKGAYKYALKLIKNTKVKDEQSELVLSSMINILLIDPKYGNFIVNYLDKNRKKFNTEKLTEIINSELFKCLELEQDQEALWFIYILRQLKLKIYAKNIINCLKYENDFITIIALDFWKNKNKDVMRKRKEATEIKSVIYDLANYLSTENYYGAHWLLLYEVDIHSLIERSIYNPINKTDFWQHIYNNNISFYNSIKR